MMVRRLIPGQSLCSRFDKLLQRIPAGCVQQPEPTRVFSSGAHGVEFSAGRRHAARTSRYAGSQSFTPKSTNHSARLPPHQPASTSLAAFAALTLSAISGRLRLKGGAVVQNTSPSSERGSGSSRSGANRISANRPSSWNHRSTILVSSLPGRGEASRTRKVVGRLTDFPNTSACCFGSEGNR